MTNNHKLMIVDENKILCWAIKKMFSEQDLLITTVNNGSDAVSEIQKKPYHSVFVDVNLPDMDGLHLLKNIRKIAPNTKVVLMAENNLDSCRRKAIDEGASHFIEKPFGVIEIREAIQNILAANDRG